MKRSRFRKKQIIGILKKRLAGLGAKELCCKHGVRDASSFNWRSTSGGIEVSNVKKLKVLKVENAKLKELLADQTMDVSTLK